MFESLQADTIMCRKIQQMFKNCHFTSGAVQFQLKILTIRYVYFVALTLGNAWSPKEDALTLKISCSNSFVSNDFVTATHDVRRIRKCGSTALGSATHFVTKCGDNVEKNSTFTAFVTLQFFGLVLDLVSL